MAGLDDPIEYLALVDFLRKRSIDIGLENGTQRTIVSRLYYGVFHHIKLRLYGPDSDRNIGHLALHKEAQKCANERGIQINIKDKLSQLQGYREMADYKRLQKIDDKFLDEVFTVYQLIEKDCQQLWNKPPLSR